VNVPKLGKGGLRWYGQHLGNVREWESRCAAAVGSPDYEIGHQCRRPRGHGPGGLFCRQHAKQAERENWSDD
jgi:hypothetical protein